MLRPIFRNATTCRRELECLCSRVRQRAILITSPNPMPSGPDAGLAKPPARTTYRRTFRLVRGLKTPELVIVDGAPGFEKAITALWSDIRGEARPMA
jgi:hypothetical protein